jgi:hypothetical protein
MLCGPHLRTGAPLYHCPGCAECEKAKAAGIVRPETFGVPSALRGRGRFREKHFDWDRIKAGMAGKAKRAESTVGKAKA